MNTKPFSDVSWLDIFRMLLNCKEMVATWTSDQRKNLPFILPQSYL